MRTEGLVSSPEPAVGVSVAPRTRQARLSPQDDHLGKGLHGSCTSEDAVASRLASSLLSLADWEEDFAVVAAEQEGEPVRVDA
jgi:hypothetical protein